MSLPADAPEPDGRPRRLRPEAWCLHCYYSLEGLDWRGQCPECGRAFNLRKRSTYSLEPRPRTWWERLRRSGVVAVVAAIIVGALAFAARELGFCVWVILTPLAVIFEVAMFYTWSGIRRRAAPLELWVITGMGVGAIFGGLFTAPLPLMGIIIGATAGGVTGLVHWLLDDVF